MLLIELCAPVVVIHNKCLNQNIKLIITHIVTDMEEYACMFTFHFLPSKNCNIVISISIYYILTFIHIYNY